MGGSIVYVYTCHVFLLCVFAFNIDHAWHHICSHPVLGTFTECETSNCMVTESSLS